MSDFSKPGDVDRLTIAFGAGGTECDRLMPRMETIPEEFRRGRTPFNEIQSRWFCDGLKKWPLNPKPGIDHKSALAHLSAIQRSFSPSHEHKSAAVAYLMSLWYEPPKTTGHKGKPLRSNPCSSA